MALQHAPLLAWIMTLITIDMKRPLSEAQWKAAQQDKGYLRCIQNMAYRRGIKILDYLGRKIVAVDVVIITIMCIINVIEILIIFIISKSVLFTTVISITFYVIKTILFPFYFIHYLHDHKYWPFSLHRKIFPLLTLIGKRMNFRISISYLYTW